MIDFYLKISKKLDIVKGWKPYDAMKHYKKYVNMENESWFDNIYYYSNSFDKDEHIDSYFQNNSHHFFLFGKPTYRNSINKPELNDLSIEYIYKIIIGNSISHELIKGNFAYILINKKTMQIEIVNSPYGVLPFNFALENSCLFVSSNLTMIKGSLQTVTVNKSALVQISMFDTILGNNTLINEIQQLQYGQQVTVKDNHLSRKNIYDHTKTFLKKPLKRNATKAKLVSTLEQNAKSWPQNRPFLMGLTGGYDCRLNFSLIPKENYKNIIAYTYGMSSSPEIGIAKKIAKKYGLKHEIIVLEDDFEKDYTQNADEVLKLGDGFTPFMRVNYFYAHRHLSQYARECITGMYGSEFIKPMHVMEDSVTINPGTVKAFFSDSIVDSLIKYFYQLKESKDAYFSEEVFTDDALQQTIELIRENYITGKEALNKEQRIFNFYLNEGMRKFFMELIRVDKMFVNHNIPYLDLDFVESLLGSMYAGVNNHIFNESLFKRRKGQLFYADAMNILSPALNNIQVDRGYKPKRLRTQIGWLYVTVGYIFGKKLRKLLKGNTTFNTKKWRTMVYDANQDVLDKKSVLFKDTLARKFQEGYHLQNEHVFGKHFSVKKWLIDNHLA